MPRESEKTVATKKNDDDKTTVVTIEPGIMSSYATAIRGHINVAMAMARTGHTKEAEEALEGIRKNLLRFTHETRRLATFREELYGNN